MMWDVCARVNALRQVIAATIPAGPSGRNAVILAALADQGAPIYVGGNTCRRISRLVQAKGHHKRGRLPHD